MLTQGDKQQYKTQCLFGSMPASKQVEATAAASSGPSFGGSASSIKMMMGSTEQAPANAWYNMRK